MSVQTGTPERTAEWEVRPDSGTVPRPSILERSKRMAVNCVGHAYRRNCTARRLALGSE